MTQPLRFCMVTTFYPPYNFGGDGIYVQRLSAELATRGHHVEVIHNADAYLTLAGREPASVAASHPGVTVHTLRSRNPLLTLLAMQQSGTAASHSRRIREILARGFDVIHYHNVSLAGGPQVLQQGTALKLYTTHEYWLVCPTHVLFRFNRQACTQRSCILCQLVYKRPLQLWRYTGLLRRSAEHVQAFVAPSRFAADIHRANGFDARFVQIPHFAAHAEPVDTDTAGQASAVPYFLFVGRLERLKGLHTLIPVFRRYRQAQLWIAGAGGQEAQLRRLAADCDNIRFLGFVTSPELRRLYRLATAVISPSLCYEVFSLVQVEASQQRTPIIARNLGAMPEVVADCGGGLVYNSDEELVEAMERLLADRAGRDEMGERGYQTYLREWTPEAHVQKYLGLIDELGRERGPR